MWSSVTWFSGWRCDDNAPLPIRFVYALRAPDSPFTVVLLYTHAIPFALHAALVVTLASTFHGR